jgi:hypothetical protein
MMPRIYKSTPPRPGPDHRAIDITRGGYPAQKLDLEGIVSDGEGGFWLANEGRSDRLIPHAICMSMPRASDRPGNRPAAGTSGP